MKEEAEQEARWKILKSWLRGEEKVAEQDSMERRTCLCLSCSSKFLFSRLPLQPGDLKYINGCLCITITCKTLTVSQETVQILQHIDCWRALTGVIRRYGSLMRPGRSLPPPIYTCFDPSGVRKEGRGGGGCDRKVLSARMFFICSSSSLACACVASS